MGCTLSKCNISGKQKMHSTYLNNHRSDVSDPNAIPACLHFAQSNRDFNIHAKFTLIETITDKNKPTEVYFKKKRKLLD